MGWSEADRDTIEKAIIDLGSGRRFVKCVIEGNLTEYSTVDLPDLRSLLTEIEEYLATTGSTSTESPIITVPVTMRKGL